MNYERLLSIISLAGVVICFMNIKRALLIGVCWLFLFSIGSMIASIIHSPLEWLGALHLIGMNVLIGFYLFCIV